MDFDNYYLKDLTDDEDFLCSGPLIESFSVP